MSFSYVSHRRGESRTFDCLYDPDYIVPGAKDVLYAAQTASSAAAPVRVYSNYDSMFVNAPKETRLHYRKRANVLLPTDTSSMHSNSSRLTAGGTGDGTSQRSHETLPSIVPPKVLKLIAAMGGGITSRSHHFLHQPYNEKPIQLPPTKSPSPSLLGVDSPNVSIVHVKLKDIPPPALSKRCERIKKLQQQKQRDDEMYYEDSCIRIDWDATTQGSIPAKRPCMSRTRATQTLYRESSAQTLPYLPAARAAHSDQPLNTLEVFRLPTILPGDAPPGLYEVEVLERSRKRWAFTEALKENFKRQLKKARLADKYTQNAHILQAFEWEHWMEREEYIQECQMLRLEVVVRMFDRREREMYEQSRDRLAARCQRIAEERKAALLKNEVRYLRTLRRLQKKHNGEKFNWRKEHITTQFGRPDSDFYAPQLRYGIDPSRRHFTLTETKAFDTHMDELESKATDMTKLNCPYANLKRLTKPKPPVDEIEFNFCSDDRLKDLYDQLKKLRSDKTKRRRQIPQCLVKKGQSVKQSVIADAHVMFQSGSQQEEPESIEKQNKPAKQKTEKDRTQGKSKLDAFLRRYPRCEKYMKFTQTETELEEIFNREQQNEEIEAMLADYEGSTIGWVMQFLGDEMCRLQEERKLHFISMLAQRERWRREAYEAGLRQKENNMRQLYEQLYQSTSVADTEICDEFFKTVFPLEVNEYVDDEAQQVVQDIARHIDADLDIWVRNFNDNQTPFNYEILRKLLVETVFPNAEQLRNKYETQMIVQHMITGVILPRVECKLIPWDITTRVIDETIDRLTDNDLLYFSTSSEEDSECDICSGQIETCSCNLAKREAAAIIRKVTRHAVPGRRWKTSTERLAHDNVRDIIDEAFETIIKDHSLHAPPEPLRKFVSYCNLLVPNRHSEISRKMWSDTDESLEVFINYNEYTPVLTKRSDHKYLISSSDDELPYTKEKMMGVLKVNQADSLNYPDSSSDIDYIENQVELSTNDHEAISKNIVSKIIRSFIPFEDGDSDSSTLEKPVTPPPVAPKKKPKRNMFATTRTIIEAPSEYRTEQSIQIVKEVTPPPVVQLENDESLLFLTADELRRLYFDRTDCKCRMKQELDDRMREKINCGKVLIVNAKDQLQEGEKVEIQNLDYTSLKQIIETDWTQIAGTSLMEEFKDGIMGIIKATADSGILDSDMMEEMNTGLEAIIKSVADMLSHSEAVPEEQQDMTNIPEPISDSLANAEQQIAHITEAGLITEEFGEILQEGSATGLTTGEPIVIVRETEDGAPTAMVAGPVFTIPLNSKEMTEGIAGMIESGLEENGVEGTIEKIPEETAEDEQQIQTAETVAFGTENIVNPDGNTTLATTLDAPEVTETATSGVTENVENVTTGNGNSTGNGNGTDNANGTGNDNNVPAQADEVENTENQAVQNPIENAEEAT